MTGKVITRMCHTLIPLPTPLFIFLSLIHWLGRAGVYEPECVAEHMGSVYKQCGRSSSTIPGIQIRFFSTPPLSLFSRSPFSRSICHLVTGNKRSQRSGLSLPIFPTQFYGLCRRADKTLEWVESCSSSILPTTAQGAVINSLLLKQDTTVHFVLLWLKNN